MSLSRPKRLHIPDLSLSHYHPDKSATYPTTVNLAHTETKHIEHFLHSWPLYKKVLKFTMLVTLFLNLVPGLELRNSCLLSSHTYQSRLEYYKRITKLVVAWFAYSHGHFCNFLSRSNIWLNSFCPLPVTILHGRQLNEKTS